MSTTFRNRLASTAFATLLFFAIGFCTSTSPAWADDSQGIDQQVATEQIADQQAASVEQATGQQAALVNSEDGQGTVEVDLAEVEESADRQTLEEPADGQIPEESADEQTPNESADEQAPIEEPLADTQDSAKEGADVAGEKEEADQTAEDPKDSANTIEPEAVQSPEVVVADQDGQSALTGSASSTASAASASSASTASSTVASSVEPSLSDTVGPAETSATPKAEAQSAKPAAAAESGVSKSTKQDAAASSGTRPTSAKLAKAKNRINTGLIRGLTTIDLNDLKLGFSYRSDLTDTVFRLFDEAILDNPGIVVSQYYLYMYSSGGYYYADKLSDMIYGKVIIGEINNAITEMVSWIPEGASQAEQAKAVHDWLVRNCMYNYPATQADQQQYKLSHYDNPWTASGALTYPYKPVCACYSAAFAAAMKRLGIPCTVVTNTSANHAWNRVKIDGKWYNVDVTWDDPLNGDKRSDAGYNATPKTTYFLKSDAYFKSTAYPGYSAYAHSKWDTQDADPAATSTLYDNWNWGSYSSPCYHAKIYALDITSSLSVGKEGRKTIAVNVNNGNANNKPFHTYTWSSNNKTIAVVTQFGIVTSGTKLGKAIITCSAEGRSDTCTVWVVGGSILDKSLSKSVKNTTFTYNGKSHVPTLMITQKLSNATYTLKSGTNYTISYLNAAGKAMASSKIVNAGTYYLVVQGKDLFSGTLKYKFVINRASIANAKVSGVANKTYNAKAQSQAKIVVKLGTKTLTRNTHYTVRYQNVNHKYIAATNVKNAGTYYVVITGKGNYANLVSKSFKINRASVKSSTITGVEAVKYNSGANNQTKIVVKHGGRTLKNGTDYTVSYLNSSGKAVSASKIGVGTYYVVVNGKGNYCNSVSSRYRVIYRPVWTGASAIPVNAYSVAVMNGTVRVISGGTYVRVAGNKVNIVGKAASGKSYATVGIYDAAGRLYAKKTVSVYNLSGDYVIESAMKSSLVLDIEGVSKRDGARMIVWTRTGGLNQKFRFVALNDGTYAIRCVHSGKYVAVDGASKDRGRKVIQWKWNGGDNQRWRIRVDENNRLVFVSKNSGYVIGINDAVAFKGRDMIQWPYSGGNNQKWELRRA